MPMTILSAAESIRQGTLTPIDLLERCLEQIDRYEPQVRAWVLVDSARARAEAEERTNELRRGRNRGLLHGIPLGIKDKPTFTLMSRNSVRPHQPA